MTAYYNEFDPFAASWLEELIKAGLIADGVVDRRSIEDVLPNDIKEFTQCHFFAGIGVWSYALRQAGWGDDQPVWTGSCPCQPFSAAGKGDGFTDERHLWPAFNHLIKECQPETVFGEQVASSDALGWIDIVQADLEAQGYAFGAADLCAAGVILPQIRQRLFWMAHSNNEGLQGFRATIREYDQGGRNTSEQHTTEGSMVAPFWHGGSEQGADGISRFVHPDIGSILDGTANRVGKMRGFGNAIVAPVAVQFIKCAMDVIK